MLLDREERTNASLPAYLLNLNVACFVHPAWAEWLTQQSNQKYPPLTRYNKHEARRRNFIFAEADILTESKTKPFEFLKFFLAKVLKNDSN